MKQPKADNENAFSERRFFSKINRYAKKAGIEVIEKSLWLYYAAKRPETPQWAKATIYGALAYFIMPIDAIADVIPGIGFTDDLTVLAAAITTVSLYINDEVKTRAHERLKSWFGNTPTSSS